MDLQLKGKTAVVTGSTAGIGLAIATTLAQEGANVVVNGRSEARAILHLAERMEHHDMGQIQLACEERACPATLPVVGMDEVVSLLLVIDEPAHVALELRKVTDDLLFFDRLAGAGRRAELAAGFLAGRDHGRRAVFELALGLLVVDRDVDHGGLGIAHDPGAVAAEVGSHRAARGRARAGVAAGGEKQGREREQGFHGKAPEMGYS